MTAFDGKGVNDLRIDLVVELIKSHFINDKSIFINKVNQIASEELKKGNKKNAEKILAVIQNKDVFIEEDSKQEFFQSSGRTITSRIIAPRDKNNNTELFEVTYPEDINDMAIVLSEEVKDKIYSVLQEYEERDLLIEKGLNFENRVLFCGPPGCGKTSLAYWLSKKLNIPIAYVRLDTLVSSLLGQTGANLRRIFDAINNNKVILFLDEFDAIAKKRDDKHELGELKRVVNSLLQNLDLLSNDVFVIAATNHDELLDKAVWRRFNSVVYLEWPSKNLRKKYIDSLIKYYDVNDNCFDYEKISMYTAGLSYADLKQITLKCIKSSVLNGKEEVSTDEFVKEIVNFTFLYNTKSDIIDLLKVKQMRDNGLSLQKLSEILDIPRTTLSDRLKKEGY